MTKGTLHNPFFLCLIEKDDLVAKNTKNNKKQKEWTKGSQQKIQTKRNKRVNQ
jgi:hypothetical protein